MGKPRRVPVARTLWVALAVYSAVSSTPALAQDASDSTDGDAPVHAPEVPRSQDDNVNATHVTATHTNTYPSGRWYGWQLLIGDAAALAGGIAIAHLAGAQGDTRTGDWLGAMWGLGMLSSLSIHAAHGQAEMALGGIGIRSVTAPTGALLGLVTHWLGTGGRRGSAGVGAQWGFVAGLGGGILMDALVLGRSRHSGPRGNWYGWQLAMLDVTAFMVGAIAVSRVNDLDRAETGLQLSLLPWITGTLVAPWFHVAHGRWNSALASFSMRAFGSGLGALVGMTGYCAASRGAAGCTGTGAAYGWFGGLLLAAAIDALLLSHEPRARTDRNARALPYVAPHPNGANAGIAYTF